MGNPVITRLGRSQIWYRKWYSDLPFNHTYKIVNTFEKITKNYLQYGLLFNKNLFMHNFWYKNFLFKTSLYNREDLNTSTYFRRYFYSHKTLTIEHTYLLREKTPEFFPMRLYVVKYLNWLVISLQWFKPFKTSRNLRKVTDPMQFKYNTSVVSKKSSFLHKTKRFKLFFCWLSYLYKTKNRPSYLF